MLVKPGRLNESPNMNGIWSAGRAVVGAQRRVRVGRRADLGDENLLKDHFRHIPWNNLN